MGYRLAVAETEGLVLDEASALAETLGEAEPDALVLGDTGEGEVLAEPEPDCNTLGEGEGTG